MSAIEVFLTSLLAVQSTSFHQQSEMKRTDSFRRGNWVNSVEELHEGGGSKQKREIGK